MKNFCVKCGKECEESLDGLCIDCWLAGRDMIAMPHHVDLRVCANCGEFDFGGRWVKRDLLTAVQDAAADSVMVVKGAEITGLSTSVEEQDPRIFVVSVHADVDVMGYPSEGDASTIVRVKNTVCRRCSRQLGSYYESILQIRTASGKLSEEVREEALAMVENSVARQAATNRQLFITKMELVPGGVDVYLSSIALGKGLAKELAEAFCAETKESPKLVGQTDDGQDMYRLTYLARLPDYRPGDVVVFQGRYCKLERANGGGGKVMDLLDFRERTVRRSDMADVKLFEKASDLKEATVVSRSGSEVQVLDPRTYATVDLRMPQGMEPGETVKVVSVDDVLYLVPRLRDSSKYSYSAGPLMIKLPEPVDRVVENLLHLANTKIPEDIGWALEAAGMWETHPVAYTQLGAIMDNMKKAERYGVPMCQDTGIPVFYVRGRFDSSIRADIARGVEKATTDVPLRPNTVDPLTRENQGSNLGQGMPIIHFVPTDDDFTQIDVLVKGAGSENMTRLGMLNPSQGIEGLEDFIVDAVLDAGGRPCPPTVVGVGIGGMSDTCVEMAKEALLMPLDADNPDPVLKEMEERLFVRLNSSGLGPMGLGGATTCLGVRIRKAACHTASLPVAVNIGCWATRRASARITPDSVEYSQGVMP